MSRENKTAVLADCVCGLNKIPRYGDVYNRLSDTLLEYETRREALGSRLNLGMDLGVRLIQPLVRKLLRDADGGLHVNGEMSPQVG